MNLFNEQALAFFSQYKLRSYRRRDILLHEDDVPNGVYLIKEGYMRLYSVSPDGQDLTRLILGPGDVFPIRWAVTQETIDYYAEPITNMETWYAPRDQFIAFVHSDDKLNLSFMQYLMHRLGTLYKRMEFLAFGNAYEKVCAILVDLADKFGRTENGKMIIDVPLTQKDIASFVGVVRETVGAEIEVLRERGILEDAPHQFIIKDFAKLKKESPLTTTL